MSKRTYDEGLLCFFPVTMRKNNNPTNNDCATDFGLLVGTAHEPSTLALVLELIACEQCTLDRGQQLVWRSRRRRCALEYALDGAHLVGVAFVGRLHARTAR